MSGVPLTSTSDGRIIALFPFDLVAWTDITGGLAETMTAELNGTGVELAVTGSMTPLARSQLEALGLDIGGGREPVGLILLTAGLRPGPQRAAGTGGTRMPMHKRLTAAVLGVASLCCGSVGSSAHAQDANANADVVVGVPNWPSARATANIIKVVLEDRLGLQVELKEMASPDIFAGMDSGSVQIHPEAWLPNYAELTAEYVERRRSVHENPHPVAASQNICTTRETAEELGVHSVFDLADPAKAAFFDTDLDAKGELWIGEESWTSTNIERIRAKSYGYDQTMQLLVASEEVAMATIDASIAVGKPVVFYCYQPHYLFQLHDIVALEEPPHNPDKWQIVLPGSATDWLEQSEAPVAWAPSHFQIDYAAALEKERPEVATFLNAIELDTGMVSEMSYALSVERQDPYTFAESWVEVHSEAVDAWLQGERP